MKLKEVEREVKRKYMTQNSHSQDRTGRDEEDFPRYASKCMEYLASLQDVPQYPNRGERQGLQHIKVEHMVAGVTRSLQQM